MFYIFNKYTIYISSDQFIVMYTTSVVIMVTRSDRFEFLILGKNDRNKTK